MLIKHFTAILGAAILFIAPTLPLHAQDTAAGQPAFELELNNANDTADGGCRLVFVAANHTGQALEQTAYEVAVFDADGVVSQILVMEFGALIEGKTKVVQFDLPGNGCAALSRIIVNDVAECRLADGSESGQCLTGLSTRSRTAIDFGI